MYRGTNGAKCAAGHLISDERYDDSLEGQSVSRSPVLDALEDSLGVKLSESDENFIDEMQRAHDEHPDNPDWLFGFKRMARNIGQKFSLTIPESVQKS